MSSLLLTILVETSSLKNFACYG